MFSICTLEYYDTNKIDKYIVNLNLLIKIEIIFLFLFQNMSFFENWFEFTCEKNRIRLKLPKLISGIILTKITIKFC